MGNAGLNSYRISVLGRFQIFFKDQPLSVKSAKARALAACVCLSAKKSVSREVLATLLWDTSDELRARTSLRQTLRSLFLSFPRNAERPFVAEGQNINLLLPGEAVDYFELHSKLDSGVVPDILLEGKDGASELLAGLDGLATEFDRFLLTERTIYSDQINGKLEKLVRAPDLGRSVRFAAAKALLKNDQTNELACRAVMQYLAEEGETAAAIRTFETLQEILDTEYDVEPSGESLDLNAKNQNGGVESTRGHTVETGCANAPGSGSRHVSARHRDGKCRSWSGESRNSKNFQGILFRPFGGADKISGVVCNRQFDICEQFQRLFPGNTDAAGRDCADRSGHPEKPAHRKIFMVRKRSASL